MAKPHESVAEIAGTFENFSISEIVIQKIWKSGDFRQGELTTAEGVPVKILRAGTWNRAEGPDFKDAELEIGGTKLRGDVEIHFYANDWQLHGHDLDANYGNVILHVVVFARPGEKLPTKNASGDAMPTLILLPFLNRALEDYANEDAMLTLEGKNDDSHFALSEILASVPAAERREMLETAARERWEQKCRFAKKRLAENDWSAACHQVVLETLGLKRNRAPMADISKWFSPQKMLEMGLDAVFDSVGEKWILNAIRPANQPRHRLSQYFSLLQKNPNWPAQMREFSKRFRRAGTLSSPTQIFRKSAKLKPLHTELASTIFASTIGGTRFETLMIDAILPLLSADYGNDFFAYWYHWFMGDVPANFPKILRENELISKETPHCNGLFQGLLQLSLRQAQPLPRTYRV